MTYFLEHIAKSLHKEFGNTLTGIVLSFRTEEQDCIF